MNIQAINKQMYRMGAVVGGVLVFGAVFEPFIPLLIALAAGLIAGFLLRSLFTSILNRRLSKDYRYTHSSAQQNTQANQTAGANTQTNTTSPLQPSTPKDALEFYRNILGLETGYTAAQLKTAYRDCAAMYHPDLFTHATEKERRHADEMMKQINIAYNALK